MQSQCVDIFSIVICEAIHMTLIKTVRMKACFTRIKIFILTNIQVSKIKLFIFIHFQHTAQKGQTFGTVPGREFALSSPRVEKYITKLFGIRIITAIILFICISFRIGITTVTFAFFLFFFFN